MIDELIIYTDGGSRGNPGKSAIGIVILGKDEKTVLMHKQFLGIGTNNQAEYKAKIRALELAKNLGKKIRMFSDSELVTKQLNGEYAVKSVELSKLYEKVKNLSESFEKVTHLSVKRSNKFISLADSLVNKALDEA